MRADPMGAIIKSANTIILYGIFTMFERAPLQRVLTLLSLVSFAACGGDSGSSGSEGSKNNISTELISIFEDLTDQVVPNSLAKKSTQLVAGDPCKDIEGTDNFEIFIKCQPILLKEYLFLAQLFVEEGKIFTSDAKKHLDTLADGDEEEFKLSSEETLVAKKTDANNYSFLVKDVDGSLMWLSRQDKMIKLKVDAYEITTGEDNALTTTADEDGVFSATINYSDSANWTVEIDAHIACNSEDTGGPNIMRMVTTLSGGIWQGKAMTYHERNSDMSCNDTGSDEKSMNLFTEYVASDDYGKANVYMVARTVTETEDFSKYGVKNICSNFPAYCPSTPDLSALGLPVCLGSDQSINWSNTCSEFDSDVSEQAFDLSAAWIAPSKLYQSEAAQIPSEL